MAHPSGEKVLPQYYPIFCSFKDSQGQRDRGFPRGSANARLAVHAKLPAQRLCVTGFDCQYCCTAAFPSYLPFPCTAPILCQGFKKSLLLLSPEIFETVAATCK